MTGNKLILDIHLESTEGIEDFIQCLPQITESLKGGYEKAIIEDKTITGIWSISPK